MLLPEHIYNIKINTFGNNFTDRHIAFTNKKRIEINKQMMDQVVKQKNKKPLCLPKLQYDKNSQDVELLAGMPIIARVNAKKYDVFNNEMFIITKITDDSIFFKDE
jgi:hypothetical protein